MTATRTGPTRTLSPSSHHLFILPLTECESRGHLSPSADTALLSRMIGYSPEDTSLSGKGSFKEYLMRQKNEDPGLPPQYGLKIYPVGSTSPHTSLNRSNTVPAGLPPPWGTPARTLGDQGPVHHPVKALLSEASGTSLPSCLQTQETNSFLHVRGRPLPTANRAGPGLRQQWAQNPTGGTKVRVPRPTLPDFHLVRTLLRHILS